MNAKLRKVLNVGSRMRGCLRDGGLREEKKKNVGSLILAFRGKQSASTVRVCLPCCCL